MSERYRDRVPFLLIYVREAHPIDGVIAARNEREGISLATAQTMDQKEAHADICIVKLDMKFPTLVDGMDNQVETVYAGWPDRLYLIGKDGRVAFKNAPGPAGFIPSQLESAIRAVIGR
jgi:hypothetical protein